MREPLTQNLEKLDRLLSMLDEDALTKKDFEAKFEQVLKLLLAMEKRNTEAIAKLQQEHIQMMGNMQMSHEQNYTELKGKVDNLFVEDKVGKIHNEVKMSMGEMKKMMTEMMDKKMKDVDNHMAKIKDGERGMKGEMGPMGPMPTAEMIQKGVSEALEDFKKEIRERVQQAVSKNRVLAGPNANAVQAHEFTGNGTRTYTVPRHRVALMLVGTQAPFIYRSGTSNDFTTANLTLTFNASLPEPAEGQNFTFLYVK